jgi:hypothetical protein
MQKSIRAYYFDDPFPIDMRKTFEYNRDVIVRLIEQHTLRDVGRFKTSLVHAIILRHTGKPLNRFLKGVLTNMRPYADVPLVIIRKGYPAHQPDMLSSYLMERELGRVV